MIKNILEEKRGFTWKQPTWFRASWILRQIQNILVTFQVFREEKSLQIPPGHFLSLFCSFFLILSWTLRMKLLPGAGSPGPSSNLPKLPLWLHPVLASKCHPWADVPQTSIPLHPLLELACWHNCYLQISKWTYLNQIPTQAPATLVSPPMDPAPPGQHLKGHLLFLPSSHSIHAHHQIDLKLPQLFTWDEFRIMINNA